jgi:hypothetical protein
MNTNSIEKMLVEEATKLHRYGSIVRVPSIRDLRRSYVSAEILSNQILVSMYTKESRV